LEWIERELRLPEGVSALPGPLRLWPYQRGIADAISDPEIERVTVVKLTRVGYTTLLTGAIGNFIANARFSGLPQGRVQTGDAVRAARRRPR
jgi:phage terminase large subunit GpA-like protein